MGHLVVAARAPVGRNQRPHGGVRNGRKREGGRGDGRAAAVHHALRRDDGKTVSMSPDNEEEEEEQQQTGPHLVYAGLHSHHDGVAEHFAILGQSFPGLQLGLVLQVHPVAGRSHLPAGRAVNPTVTFATVGVHYLR